MRCGMLPGSEIASRYVCPSTQCPLGLNPGGWTEQIEAWWKKTPTSAELPRKARRFIAYKLTHRDSGKSYIGVTFRTLRQRKDSHFYKGAGRIGAAMRKYGRDAFDMEWIASSWSIKDLHALERILIAQHVTMADDGYNLCAGGDGVWEPSEETRQKMSAKASARVGRVVSAETKAKIAASLTGHGFAPKTLAKMRAAKLGGKASDETKALLSSQRRGKKLPKRTPEQIEAMSARLRGKKQKPRSPEVCAKMAAARRGKKQTPATVAKIKATWAARRAAGLKNAPRRYETNVAQRQQELF
jgi:group I intron endonuclease